MPNLGLVVCFRKERLALETQKTRHFGYNHVGPLMSPLPIYEMTSSYREDREKRQEGF